MAGCDVYLGLFLPSADELATLTVSRNWSPLAKQKLFYSPVDFCKLLLMRALL